MLEIAGLVRGSDYDAFDIGGALTLAGMLDVSFFDAGSGLFSANPGDTLDLFSAETIYGSFDALVLATLAPDLGWQLDYLTDFSGTTDLVRLSVVSTLPVPAAVWLFGSGLLGLVGISMRKKRLDHRRPFGPYFFRARKCRLFLRHVAAPWSLGNGKFLAELGPASCRQGINVNLNGGYV